MAIPAYLRTRVTWVSDDLCVRGLFIGSLVTAVTIRAGDLTMHRLGKLLGIDKHFLPWLQRSHLAPSTLTCVLRDNFLFWFGGVD
jgi:hypothetical protein